MSKFSIGSRVVKPESGNHGTVVEVMPPRRGRQLYKVSWEGYISDELEVNLIPDCDIADPYERCINGIFGSYSDFSKKNTTFKIKSKNKKNIMNKMQLLFDGKIALESILKEMAKVISEYNKKESKNNIISEPKATACKNIFYSQGKCAPFSNSRRNAKVFSSPSSRSMVRIYSSSCWV